MEQTSLPPAPNVQSLGRKSWTAYVTLAIFGLFALLVVAPVALAYSFWIGLLSIVFFGGAVIYHFLLLRSFHLYQDDYGVWVYYGVFPWNTGITGVKWRDLEEAIYMPTFWSWLCNSYTVRISHRFTLASEILLSHMASGRDVVQMINERHIRFANAGLT